jgi:hypothetical protein
MNKTKNKILPFPPPKEPPGPTIVCQIGRERFAIHIEIEDLPLETPVIQLKSQPPKRRRIK